MLYYEIHIQFHHKSLHLKFLDGFHVVITKVHFTFNTHTQHLIITILIIFYRILQQVHTLCYLCVNWQCCCKFIVILCFVLCCIGGKVLILHIQFTLYRKCVVIRSSSYINLVDIEEVPWVWCNAIISSLISFREYMHIIIYCIVYHSYATCFVIS